LKTKLKNEKKTIAKNKPTLSASCGGKPFHITGTVENQLMMLHGMAHIARRRLVVIITKYKNADCVAAELLFFNSP
jgi:hypothetical protein